MIWYDMNSSAGAVGVSYPVFTFVNLLETTLYIMKTEKISSVS